MRQPMRPNAFDLPQAQVVFPRTSPWAIASTATPLYDYPTTLAADTATTIVNCGHAPDALPNCANYCDPQSRIRFIECPQP